MLTYIHVLFDMYKFVSYMYIPCGPETLQRKVFGYVFAKDPKGKRKTLKALKGKLLQFGAQRMLRN